ncbi:hypothetical protein GCE9029_03444 [Grimontia celer]|uniref:Uncharacterized protein n=2 Tax=Grimontia celer TaxID=1796497 RepID=A0A128F7L6_9GAMM|nr:hypothetical protein GCE9029_03444 [Grimontia celer]
MITFSLATLSYASDAPNSNTNILKEAPPEAIEFLKGVTEEDYYPLIKPGDWVGIGASSVYQVLIGTEEAPKLVVAYAADTEENYFFLNWDSDLDVEKAASNAFKNINSLKVEYFYPNGFENQVLTAKPDAFVSETILSENQMNRIHRELGKEEIIVSIPTRTTLSAVAFDSSDEIFAKFAGVHVDAWNEERNARISPYLFILKNGKIVNYLNLGE